MPRDYSGQNLRGRSFKGQDLTGANFSQADIRGADFTNAILKGANFKEANAGLKFHWIFILLPLSLIISSLSGFTSAIMINFNIYFWFYKRLSAVFVIAYSTIFISIVRTILNNHLG
ncbi:MAG: pentapeptide repeat-containing protein, partial [Dolichospermum sp.]